MTHNRGLNNKTNHIQERTLRIVYDDYSSSFEDLLNKDKSVTIHQRNLQQLAIKIFEIKIGIAPIIMNEIFTFVKSNTSNLKSGMPLSKVNLHSTQYGTKSIGNLGAKIWNLGPVHMKDLKALSTFKNQIKKWMPKDCPCRLCKIYVAQVGFLWKLLRLFSSFSGIQYCLFYSFSYCFILFYLFLYSFYYSIYVIYVFFISIYVFIYFINLFIHLFFFCF